MIADKPKWAPSVWQSTDGYLYAQFADGHVLKFLNVEFTKLLKLLPYVEHQHGFVSGGQNIADRIIRQRKTKVARKRGVQPLDEATTERLRSIAKRLEEKK
jgi:hypothetical protein